MAERSGAAGEQRHVHRSASQCVRRFSSGVSHHRDAVETLVVSVRPRLVIPVAVTKSGRSRTTSVATPPLPVRSASRNRPPGSRSSWESLDQGADSGRPALAETVPRAWAVRVSGARRGPLNSDNPTSVGDASTRQPPCLCGLHNHRRRWPGCGSGRRRDPPSRTRRSGFDVRDLDQAASLDRHRGTAHGAGVRPPSAADTSGLVAGAPPPD